MLAYASRVVYRVLPSGSVCILVLCQFGSWPGPQPSQVGAWFHFGARKQIRKGYPLITGLQSDNNKGVAIVVKKTASKA